MTILLSCCEHRASIVANEVKYLAPESEIIIILRLLLVNWTSSFCWSASNYAQQKFGSIEEPTYCWRHTRGQNVRPSDINMVHIGWCGGK